MKPNRWIITLPILAVYGCGSLTATADETADKIKALEQQNELLNQRVRNLEELLGQKMKALQEEMDQKVKSIAQQREMDSKAVEVKFKEATSKFKTPDWVTGVKLGSDLRVRYDGIYAPDKDFVTRWRIRPRLRLGAITTLKDDFDIGVRLTSTPTLGKDSGGDPVSNQLTAEDNASRKPVGIDWAYVKWAPIHTEKWTGSFTLGKMENPPNYSEDVFDVDYTPEGAAEQFSYKLTKNQTLSTYFGQYMLDELQFSGKDPFLFLEQLRLESKWSERVSTAVAVSGLSITSPESLTTANVPDSNHGNTRNTNGVPLVDYQLLIVDGGVTYNLESFPFYNGPFPIRFGGDYLHNFGASRDNSAYSFGPSIGKVSQTGKVQKGNWEISYRYQELQGNANYEELVASDNGAFYRTRPIWEPATLKVPTYLNGLNLRGHLFRVAYAPFDSLVMDARLSLNKAIKQVPENDRPEGMRFMFDLIWKF